MCHAQSMLCVVWQSQHSWGIPVLAILVPYQWWYDLVGSPCNDHGTQGKPWRNGTMCRFCSNRGWGWVNVFPTLWLCQNSY